MLCLTINNKDKTVYSRLGGDPLTDTRDQNWDSRGENIREYVNRKTQGGWRLSCVFSSTPKITGRYLDVTSDTIPDEGWSLIHLVK